MSLTRQFKRQQQLQEIRNTYCRKCGNKLVVRKGVAVCKKCGTEHGKVGDRV